MLYEVDSIEKDFIKLISLDDKKKKTILKNSIDFDVFEGDILLYDDGVYSRVSYDEGKDERIKNKFQRLKKAVSSK